MTQIQLPFPVSVNALHGVSGGRKILSKEARAWKGAAAWEIAIQKPQKHKGPVSIRLEYTPPDKRRRDPDNYLKVVMDALVKSGVIEDDNSEIVRERWEVWREPDKEKAGVSIRVKGFEKRW